MPFSKYINLSNSLVNTTRKADYAQLPSEWRKEFCRLIYDGLEHSVAVRRNLIFYQEYLNKRTDVIKCFSTEGEYLYLKDKNRSSL